ncbi:MAG: glycosyltransferase family 2 protein [Methanobacterium sp.]|jgi:glycosyltransferase involved in cell wall biosynthesis
MESLKLKSVKNHSVTQPLVSIITPTYNHEKFIGTCIESVLKQTYQNWEMIIIDDGSTDKTGFIVAKYNDNRIRYVKQENVGIWKLKGTYNKALNMSSGNLIAILEGDDAWPSSKLEQQIKIFEKPNVVLSWGRMNTINDKNEIISFDIKSLKHFIDMPQEELIRNFIVANLIQPCTVMIDKNALLSIGGFLQDKNAPYVDYNTFLELSLKGRFYPSNKLLGYWRKHKSQVTTKKQNEMNKAFMVSVDFYEKLDPSLKNKINFNINDKLKVCKIMLNDQIAVSARVSLIEGNWNEALTQYKTLFRKGNFSIKLQSFIGMICAIFRKDFEWVSVITCKPKLRDNSGEWDSTLYDKNKNLSLFFKIQIFVFKVFLRLELKEYFIDFSV